MFKVGQNVFVIDPETKEIDGLGVVVMEFCNDFVVVEFLNRNHDGLIISFDDLIGA